MKKQLNIIISFLAVTALLCCSPKPEENMLDNFYTDTELKLPKLSDFPLNHIEVDTSDQLESRTYPFNISISEEDVIYFNDTIDYTKFYWWEDTVAYSTSGLLEIIVDTSQLLSWKYWEDYIVQPTLITEDGREIRPKPYKPPYENVVKLPVFIHNYGDSVEAIEVHDRRLVIIQEALNEKNEWKPIEYFAYSGCGNSYGIRKIESQKFMLFTINKYHGDFKTRLRLKMRSNGKVFVSNEFSGAVNKSQFKASEQSDMFGHSYLNESGY